MALYRKLRLLAAKAEGTPGTPETLLATDAVDRVSNLEFEFLTVKTSYERPGSMGKLAGIFGVRTARIRFRMPLSAETTTPRVAALYLAACGLGNSSGGTFARVQNGQPNIPSTTLETLTQKFMLDGTARTLYGCMGNAILRHVAGEPVWIDFDFKGKYTGAAVQNTVASIAYSTAYTINVALGTGFLAGMQVFASDGVNAISGTIDSVAENALLLKTTGVMVTGTPASMTAGTVIRGGSAIAAESILTPSFNLPTPVRFGNSGLAFGSAPAQFSPRVSKLDLDLGNKVEFMENENAADGSGIDFAYIDDFDTIAAFDPEQISPAANDYYTQWEAGLMMPVTWKAAAGADSVTFAMSQAEYVNFKEGTRRGLATFDMGFQDDNADLSLVFATT